MSDITEITKGDPRWGFIFRAKAGDEAFGTRAVFDVGANVGQSHRVLRKLMPAH